MNITYVTSYDKWGQNFNGFVLVKALKALNHQARLVVMERHIDDSDIIQIGSPAFQKFNKVLAKIEQRLSLHSILPVYSLPLTFSPYFNQADVVHLQLLHARQFISLLALPYLGTRQKIVWTIHDPWITTGHCVYPLDCDRWKTGCGKCPNISMPIEMKKDQTALNWKIKHWVMHHSNMTIVVASDWMENLVKESPILSHLPYRKIPFGIDTKVFRPKDKRLCRQELGIPENAKVLAFRSTPHRFDFKGTPYIEKALQLINFDDPVYLITLDEQGGLNSLRDRYHFIELGWVSDPDAISNALSAADVFLMPSTAEAFGLMAIEAMACGLPVIVFEGTSLPSVVQVPNGGLAVPYKDHEALAKAIILLLENEQLRSEMSCNAYQIANRDYKLEQYVSRHLDLYQSLKEQLP